MPQDGDYGGFEPGQGGVRGHHASKAVNGMRAVCCGVRGRPAGMSAAGRTGDISHPAQLPFFHVIGQLVNGMHGLEYLYALVLDKNTVFTLIVVNGSDLCLALSKRT